MEKLFFNILHQPINFSTAPLTPDAKSILEQVCGVELWKDLVNSFIHSLAPGARLYAATRLRTHGWRRDHAAYVLSHGSLGQDAEASTGRALQADSCRFMFREVYCVYRTIYHGD